MWQIVIAGLGLLDIIFSTLFIEHFTKFRPGLAEKYMLKEDFISQMETSKQEVNRLHTENREDHRHINEEIRKMNEDFNKQFVNMTKEFNGQFGKFNDQFLSVIKCLNKLNKLNGGKEGNA